MINRDLREGEGHVGITPLEVAAPQSKREARTVRLMFHPQHVCIVRVYLRQRLNRQREMERDKVAPVGLRYRRSLVVGHFAVDPRSGEELHPRDSLGGITI